MKDWSAAQSLSDLGELTTLWILGRIQSHPLSQDAPPDDETMKIRAALVRLNRQGFVTDFSQPGEKLKNGFAQRAAVSGFCPETIAKKLASTTLCSDLIALAYPPGASGGCRIPITLDDYHPFTWLGSSGFEDNRAPFEGLNRKALESLRQSWYVVLVDPRWGRRKYLWREALSALGTGVGPFQPSPSPSLELETDFVY